MREAPIATFNAKTYLADPYAELARLRRETPVVRVKRRPMPDSYFITRYDDVLAVLRDDDRFVHEPWNAGKPRTRFNQWFHKWTNLGLSDTMILRDAPDHRRLRGLVHQAFTPARVEALSARMTQLVERMLDAMQAEGRADLVKGLALPLPITVICDLMGMAEDERPIFYRQAGGAVEAESQAFGMVRIMFRVAWIARYFRGLVNRRRAVRGDDLLSAMIAAEENGQRLTTDELVGSTFLLLFAGYETTVNPISSGLLALLDHPEQMERLRRDPSLIDAAVEELLRYTSPVQIPPPRYAREDVELSGVRIPRGGLAVAAIASANHDETRFPDPEKLDLGRSPNKHLGFGFGSHYCLGAPLARLEARIAIPAFLQRFPNARLAIPRDQVRWRKSLSLRGLAELPLELR